MATLQPPSTFVANTVLTADALNNHVSQAIPLPDLINQRPELTTGVASNDELLINDISAGIRKITVQNIAAGLPSGTTAADFTTTGQATIGTDLTVNGNTTIGNASTDTATINAALTVGGTTALNNNSTIGPAAKTGSYARVGTVMTVTSVGHGLVNGDSRWFSISNNTALSGVYSISSATTDTFIITVADSGATSGTTGQFSWYEKTSTIQSTLAGTIQGDISVQTKTVNQGAGDEFLAKDSSDSNKLRSVSGSVVKAWGRINLAFTTLTGTVNRTSPSTTATISTTGSVDHNLRVGDSIYLKGGITTGWYNVVTVPSSSTFTVTTTANTTVSASISWYKHDVVVGNNVYAVYGQDNLRVMFVLFNDKPPSASSFAIFSNLDLTTTTQTYWPVQNTATTGFLPTGFVKTGNGFGVWLNDSGAGGATTTNGYLEVMSIW